MSGVHNKSAYTVQDPRSTVQYSFLKYNSWCNFMESVWANALWKVGCSRHSWPLQFNFYKLTYQNFDSDKCFTPFTPPQTAYILIPKTLSKFSKLNNKNNKKKHPKIPKIQKQLQEVKKTFRKQILPKVDILIPKHYWNFKNWKISPKSQQKQL